MASALDTFRNPPPEIDELSFVFSGPYTGGFTGGPPCNPQVDDIAGNNAFFQALCVAGTIQAGKGIVLPSTQFASARTSTTQVIPTHVLPFPDITSYNKINVWNQAQAGFGLPVIPTGVQIPGTRANYLITLWLPGILGGAPAGPYEIIGNCIYQSVDFAPNFLVFNAVCTFVQAELDPVFMCTWQFPQITSPNGGTIEFWLGQTSGQTFTLDAGATLGISALFLV